MTQKMQGWEMKFTNFTVLVVTVLLMSCQTAIKNESNQSVGSFKFYSSMWINLHHFIYNQALELAETSTELDVFNESEKQKLNKAIQFYKDHFKNKDLVFDEDLITIDNQLSAVENSKHLQGSGLPPALVSVLEEVSPIYVSHIWTDQDRKNKQWIQSTILLLEKYSDKIQKKLEIAINRNFIIPNYRIDVVRKANWAGAYTTQNPSHTVISSSLDKYEGLAALEMVFHESLHTGLFDEILQELKQIMTNKKMQDSQQLWHALHFFIVGQAVQSVLTTHGIDYSPYAYRNEMFTAGKKWFKYEKLFRKYRVDTHFNKDVRYKSLESIVNDLQKNQVDFKAIFADQEACFIMKSLKNEKKVIEYNKAHCQKRFSPYSTFKIPAAIIGFEEGILTSHDQAIKWDGTDYRRKEINQDLTPLLWMKHSAIWVTQWITNQLRIKKIRKYLKDFAYGNQDFSGGLNSAWLSSSLKISGYEQIEFLSKFWKRKLPLSEKTYELSKETIFISSLGRNISLFGKTGSGCLDKWCKDKPGRMQGWFVGILTTEHEDYVFAAHTLDRLPQSEPGGLRARQAVKEIISEIEL